MDILPVAERPAVIPALFYDVDFIGGQIVAEQIATHLGDPYLLRLRMNGHEHRVPEAGGKGLEASSFGWNDEDLRPAPVLFNADVAGGAD